MKKQLREYLDLQIEEKKKMQDFERTLDHEQARIWKIDTQQYQEQENDVKQQVKFFILFYFLLIIHLFSFLFNKHT